MGSIAKASGLYRSDDAGGHWQAVSTPDGEAVVALAVDEPSAVLYAGTGSGVFRSSDAGASWERTAYPGNASLIALNPANPSDLLVAGEDGGLRRSVDGGGTFRRVTVARAETASVIFANADTVLAGGLGVLVSRDRGQTWRAANTGLVATSVDWLAADAKQPGLAYAITDSSDVVLRTTDGGRSWIEVGPDTTENNPVSDRLFSDPRRTGVVYLAAGDDLYMTQDSGTHWRVAGIHGFVRWLAVDPSSGTLYAACGEGCYWRPGLWTKRPGRAWRRLEPGYPIAVAVDGHGTVYASFEGSLRRSLDGGKTWRRLGLSSIRQVFADPRHPRRVYAIGDDTLYASASRGQTWQQPVGAGVGTLLVDPARDRVLVTRAYYEEGDPLLVLRRIHGRWRTTSGGFPELGVNSLAAGAGTIYAGTAGAGVYVLASGQPRPAPRPRVR